MGRGLGRAPTGRSAMGHDGLLAPHPTASPGGATGQLCPSLPYILGTWAQACGEIGEAGPWREAAWRGLRRLLSSDGARRAPGDRWRLKQSGRQAGRGTGGEPEHAGACVLWGTSSCMTPIGMTPHSGLHFHLANLTIQTGRKASSGKGSSEL